MPTNNAEAFRLPLPMAQKLHVLDLAHHLMGAQRDGDEHAYAVLLGAWQLLLGGCSEEDAYAFAARLVADPREIGTGYAYIAPF